MINFVAKVFINVYQTLWQIFLKEVAKIIIRIATKDFNHPITQSSNRQIY